MRSGPYTVASAARCILQLAIAICGSSLPSLCNSGPLGPYSSTTWVQKDGLPQDEIRAIAQTSDGHLWLGTEEGLARFDGYEFTIYDKDSGNLPSNAVTSLAAAPEGSLWIGTAGGLVRYSDRQFHTYRSSDGLPEDSVAGLLVDHAGVLWIIAGGALSRFENGKIERVAFRNDTTFAVRAICEDRNHTLWLVGSGGLAQLTEERIVIKVAAPLVRGNLITRLIADSDGRILMGGPSGIIEYSANGNIRRFGKRDGLPSSHIRALWVDRGGNLWVGTNVGIARRVGDRFDTISSSEGFNQDVVRCVYDDREGNLWIGTVNGLTRLRDDALISYGKDLGMTKNDPTVLYQDTQGRVWVGFHTSGLTMLSAKGRQHLSVRDGLPSDEIYSIRETREKELLVGTREGLAWIRGSQVRTYRPTDELGRFSVFDALEDASGRVWLALPGGLAQLRNGRLRTVVPGGTLNASWAVTLAEGVDGTLWMGTFGQGIWRIREETKTHFTTDNGLSSNQIRSLCEDQYGTLWIATLGGGLNAFVNNKFLHFSARDGLPSDNITDIVDDGAWLWLATPRGICRISKRQLRDFAAQRVKILSPISYGEEDGLRSAQSAPGYPVAGGGIRTTDGKLWFPTSRGLVIIDPNVAQQPEIAPMIQFDNMIVDGKGISLSQPVRLSPGSVSVQIRYKAIHLRAPERVQYSYKLDGLDSDWILAGHRREITYNRLGQGKYHFWVRAALPTGLAEEKAYNFEKLPAFYETISFQLSSAILLVAAAFGLYFLRVRQLRYRFALVLEERARLAREIHDTLTQGFVGISSQLEGVDLALNADLKEARQHLLLARRMARHSITEARRSVRDLRASVLEGRNLGAALRAGGEMWTAHAGIAVSVDVSGARRALPEELEQHLLRIAQEAVTNACKHGAPTKISIHLSMDNHRLAMSITDDGKGFDSSEAFSSSGGHFGLVGMRERAERLGGELLLSTERGRGTTIDVSVPLP